MTSSELVRLSLPNSLYLLTNHQLLQAIALSMLRGGNISGGQEPSADVSLIRLDVKQQLISLATGQTV